MVTGNIPITTDPVPAYATEEEWRGKYGISTTDESSAQFVTDLREAHFQVREEAYYFVRERIIFKNSNNVAYLPLKWLTDGTMNSTVDKNDLLIYQLAEDGLSFDTVELTNVASVDAFNNSITFESSFSPTRQLYVTYYACGKPFDEIVTDKVKRAVMAYVTLLCLERLRFKWGLKGSTGWSAGGVTVNKDLSFYKDTYNQAKADYKKYISGLKPFVGRASKTGSAGGNFVYDPNVAYSSQMLARQRIRRSYRW